MVSSPFPLRIPLPTALSPPCGSLSDSLPLLRPVCPFTILHSASSTNATLSPPFFLNPHFRLLPHRCIERRCSHQTELEEGEVKTERQIHFKRGIKRDKETESVTRLTASPGPSPPAQLSHKWNPQPQR